MATHTLKADGSGTLGTTTLEDTIENGSVNDGDIIQISPGTYTEDGQITSKTVTLEFIEAGNYVFDWSASTINDNIIQIVNDTITLDGHKDAVVTFKPPKMTTVRGFVMLWVQATSQVCGFVSKNILLHFYGDQPGDADDAQAICFRLFASAVSTINLDLERCIIDRFDQVITDETSNATVNVDINGSAILESRNGIDIDTASTNDINIVNSLIAGAYSIQIEAGGSTTIDIDNSLILSGGNNAAVRESGSGVISLENSRMTYRYAGGSMNGSGGNAVAETADNQVDEEVTPTKWSSFNKGGMIALGVDDSSSYDDFQTIVKAAADANGVKACYALDLTHPDLNTLTDAQWNQLRQDVNNGHELAVHTRRASNLGSLSGMAISHTGTATTATVTIASGVITLNVDSSPVATYTLSDFFDLGDLANEIHTNVTDWTAATYDAQGNKFPAGSSLVFGSNAQDRNYTSSEPAFTLADVTDSDADGVTLVLLQDATRYLNEEIGECRKDIERKTNFSPRTLVYPTSYSPIFSGGYDNPITDAQIEAQGIDLARANSMGTYLWGKNRPITGYYGYTIMNAPNIPLESGDGIIAGQTEAVIKAKAAALANYCNITGTCLTVFGHNNITLQEMTWYIEGILEANGTIGTMSQLADYIRLGKGAHPNVTVSTTTQSDIIYYRHDHETVNTALATADVDSSFADIEAGKNVTGRTPVGLNGEPIANISPTIGPIQSKDATFHPAKL